MIVRLRFKTKYFWIFPCLASFVLAGCKNSLPGSDVKIQENLDSDILITEKDEKYEAHIARVPEGITSLSFKSPENLAGTIFEYKNGKYTVSKGDLSAEYNLDPLEKNSFIPQIESIFEALNNKNDLKADLVEGENLIFKIDFKNLGAKIKTNKEGKILEIEIPSRDERIEFSS